MKFSNIFKEQIEPSLSTSLEDDNVKLGFDGREITLTYKNMQNTNPPNLRRVVYKMTMLAVIGLFSTYEDLCKVNKTFDPKNYKHECVYQRCKSMKEKLHHLLGDELFDTIVYAEQDLDDIYGD